MTHPQDTTPANPAHGVSGLTISALQSAHVERQEEWCPDQKPDLSFRGNEMAGEVGEACNVIKKLERERHGWRGSRATKEQLAEELADVVHTAVLCAITAGIDLEPAVFDKFNSTSEKNGLKSRLTAAIGAGGQAKTFQQRVQPWMMACFGPEISVDKLERGDRLVEEVLELVQCGDYPRERIAALTEYVYGRPKGEPAQEVGGVMVTLAAYCLAHGLDMHKAAEAELARIWTKVEKIRAKQAAKPTGSALPVAHPAPSGQATVEEIARIIDPTAFECTPALYGLADDDTAGFKKTFAYGAQLVALDKAKAIAALSSATAQPGWREPTAWLGEADGFKSFTRSATVAAHWKRDNMKVTPVCEASPLPGGAK